MKLMLGWTWDGAVRYARDHQWAINQMTRSFTTGDGGRVMFLCGDTILDVQRLRGVEIEFGGVYRGHAVKLCDEIETWLQSRVRIMLEKSIESAK